MELTNRVYVAGHRGMVGSAVCRALAKKGYANVVTRTHKELDLLDPAAVAAFYTAEKPDVAVICAARVGGIGANSAVTLFILSQGFISALGPADPLSSILSFCSLSHLFSALQGRSNTSTTCFKGQCTTDCI